MKLLMENWREYLENKDLIEAQTQALNELSEHDYEVIKNWMAEAPEEAYSFGNIFGGKKRIAIPVETGAASGPIGGIVEFFQSNGWNIDFANSTVSKESETTIPKGPRAGEKTKQIKKARIGKTLAAAQKLFDRFNEDQTEKVKNKIKEEYPEVFNAGKVMAFARTLPDLIEFWNNKSEFYRQNPEAAFEKESPFITILSRHPVDVVRMSDMNSIKSCHSRGGGYFQCAVAESRGHGPIAYLVPRKQFEQYFDVDLSKTKPEDVDLDAGGEEIFEDRERGIPGLRPEGRVRLRKYSDGSTTFAAPERRTYAPHGARTPPNFLKGVTKWALETQKKELGDPNELADAITSDEFSRFGGSYGDTQDGEVIAAMLESVIGEEKYDDLKQHGDVPDESEDEDEIQAELEGGSIEAAAEEAQDWADENLKHINIYHELMDDDDHPRVYYSANVGIDLDDFGEPAPRFESDWDDHEDEVTEIIINVLNSYNVYPESGNVELYNDTWQTSIDADYDDEPTPAGFQSFAENLQHADENWEDVIEDIRAGLIEKNIIVPQITQASAQFKTYKNISPQINEEEKKVSVFLKNPIVLNNNMRSFKVHDITTQEKIKALFREKFTTQVRRSLFDLYSENTGNTPYSFDPFKQGLHVDLDGVKLKFQLDFDYTKDSDFDPIKRFLNMLNINNNFEAFRRLAERSYIQALAGAVKTQGLEEPAQEPEEKPAEEEETRQMPPTTYKKMPMKESKKTKVSDKILFESWRRYMGK